MGVVKKCFKLIQLEQLYDKKNYPEKNVISYLRQWNPRLQQDSYGNLYLINPGTPILNAHMDTVQGSKDTKGCRKLKLKKDIISAKNSIIGGDDKCGIAIAMQLYEELGDKISLLFTRQEEVGCLGIKEFVKNEETLNLLKQAPYALTLDRRGNGDIIGEDNCYCSQEFEDRIAEITKPFGYKPARGLCSDANTISTYINVVNLSVGYYNPHSDKEYIECKDLINAMEAVRAIVNTIKSTEKFEIYKNTYTFPSGSLFDRDLNPYYKPSKSYPYDDDYRSDQYDKYLFGGMDKKKSKEDIKEDIKVLLDFFEYDGDTGLLHVKKDFEIGRIDEDEVYDIEKGEYYLYDLVDETFAYDSNKDSNKDTSEVSKEALTVKYGI